MSGMFSKKIAMAILAGVSTIALSSAANAGSKDLALGNYDSGWTASWAPEFDGLIDVSIDGATQNGGVMIQKSVNFTPAFYNDEGGFVNPAVITFTQRAGLESYASTIVINDEQLTNNTGSDWTGFRMFLMGNSATFDQAASATFSVNPFTSSSFSSASEFNASNGVVANGSVWYPGATGNLVINANPNQAGNAAFTLKEQPTQVIPLPAAVWSGLMGLGGLGLLASGKKLKKLA